MPVLAQVGIAAKYVRDSGIGSDPAVVFSENFESSVVTWSARFNGGAPSGIGTSPDHPTASGGVQSARLIPSGASGTLYRQLPTDYEQVWMRYYVKYLGNVSHHSGGYIGGYFPPSSFPQGDAGIKGIRPNLDRVFISAFEQRGTPDGIAPQTHMGTYNNWVDMPGLGFNGLYFGRDLLITENPQLNLNTWQCVEMRVKMNSTVASHDGNCKSGSMMPRSRTSRRFARRAYDTNGIGHGSGLGFPGLLWRDVLTYGVNWIKLQNYNDAGTPFDVLFDDLVVATSRIGCINSGTVAKLPAATNLRVLP
jgi:hypothetical protein